MVPGAILPGYKLPDGKIIAANYNSELAALQISTGHASRFWPIELYTTSHWSRLHPYRNLRNNLDRDIRRVVPLAELGDVARIIHNHTQPVRLVNVQAVRYRQ